MNTSKQANTTAIPSGSKRYFASINDVITVKKQSSNAVDNVTLGLDILQTVLEAVDTLPFIKTIAAIGVQILQLVSVRLS
jgi:mannose/fructose/N-acetylgalactosamine-specific phosphotransferase system component IIB